MMKKTSHLRAAAFAIFCLPAGVVMLAIAHPQTPSAMTTNAINKGSVVTRHATGTFDVKLNALTPHHQAETPPLSRMSIDKQFHGDIDATSKGEMLAAGTAVKGSAGYVAMERVTGKLQGHSGSFVLQHSGTMNRGSPQLSVTVVPDSGTDQLKGLAGKMTIKIEGEKHFYDFEYTLPEAP